MAGFVACQGWKTTSVRRTGFNIGVENELRPVAGGLYSFPLTHLQEPLLIDAAIVSSVCIQRHSSPSHL